MDIRASIRTGMMLLGMLAAAAGEVAGQQRRITNPSQLEERVMARAVQELPTLERLFPQNPGRPVSVEGSRR